MAFDHLPNAPITEAVLDVHVRARPGFDPTTFKALADQLREEFPQSRERRKFHFEIRGPGGADPKTQDLGVDGFFFTSEDGRDVAQFRVDGFALNRLKPYQQWDVWFPKFRRLWKLYCRIAEPEVVVRIGARCINHIALPPEGLLEDYLTTPPGVPAALVNHVTGFTSRLALSDGGDPERSLTLVQALQPSADGLTSQLLVDIDAYMAGAFETDKVSELLEPLHDLRNRAFFSSLTDRVVKDFK